MNAERDLTPVNSREGLRVLKRRLLRKSLRSGALLRRIPYLCHNAWMLLQQGHFSMNKLARRLLADTAPRTLTPFDLAVAYLEGGAAAYVHDYVDARVKVAFVHVDYGRAGYNRSLDEDCYPDFDRIYAVSSKTREAFVQVYPECATRTEVFCNPLDVEKIRAMADVGSDYAVMHGIGMGKRRNVPNAEEIDFNNCLQDCPIVCNHNIKDDKKEENSPISYDFSIRNDLHEEKDWMNDEASIENTSIVKECHENTGIFGTETDFHILTVARLYAQKALDISVEAMALLKGRGLDMRWYVLGDGEERERLQKQIVRLGLEGDFVLLGEVANPYPYFAGCDLYVHASRYEGQSVAVREAQVLGCPILVSDTPGNREVVRDGVDGLVCALDAKSIADAVERLYHNADLRNRLGAVAAAKPQGEAELYKLYQLIDSL